MILTLNKKDDWKMMNFSSCSQQFKSIDEISYEKKNWTQE